MAIEEVITSIGGDFGESMKMLITILQIVGGLVSIYLIFLIINLFFNIRKNKVMKEILNILKEINEKLDKNEKNIKLTKK